MPGDDDKPEIETPAAAPVPNPAPAVEAAKLPEAKVEAPIAAPVDVEAALAAQRIELELKHAEAAEAATVAANRRLEAATARADSGLALARDAAGIVDPALERMAFEELQRLAGDKPITPALVVELQAIKPWMFARAEAAHEPTNTGRPASGSRPPERQPVQPSPLTQTPEEWSATKRKLGLAPG
jgi:hypothetical protein